MLLCCSPLKRQNLNNRALGDIFVLELYNVYGDTWSVCVVCILDNKYNSQHYSNLMCIKVTIKSVPEHPKVMTDNVLYTANVLYTDDICTSVSDVLLIVSPVCIS